MGKERERNEGSEEENKERNTCQKKVKSLKIKK